MRARRSRLPAYALLPLLLATATAMTRTAPSWGSEPLHVNQPKTRFRLIEEGRKLPVDLPTVVRLAAANNLDILEAKARYEEVKGVRNATLSTFLPQFTGSFRAERIDGQIQASFGELGRRSFSTLVPAARFEISLNPASAFFEALAAHKVLRAAESRTAYTSRRILARAVAEHFRLQAALARVNIASQALAASRELLRVARARETEGTGLKVDVRRAEARVADDERFLTRAAMAFRKASIALATTLEVDPTVTLFPAEPGIKELTLTDAEAEIHQLIATALARRADLEAQELRLEAAKKKVAAAWSNAVAPDVYGFFEESAIGKTDSTLGNRQIYGGFLGFTLKPGSLGLARAAAARAEIARIREKRLHNRIVGEVISARESVLSAKEAVSAALRQVQAAESSFLLSQARFQGGVGMSLEVLESQAELSSSREALVSAITNYNTSQVFLLEALGSISPASFGVNSLPGSPAVSDPWQSSLPR